MITECAVQVCKADQSDYADGSIPMFLKRSGNVVLLVDANGKPLQEVTKVGVHCNEAGILMATVDLGVAGWYGEDNQRYLSGDELPTDNGTIVERPSTMMSGKGYIEKHVSSAKRK